MFEGEGCVWLLRTATSRGSAAACIRMTDLDVLERLRAVVGFGKINGPTVSGRRKPIWQWRINGTEPVETIFAGMSDWLCARRRARFEEVLAAAKKNRAAVIAARIERRAQKHMGQSVLFGDVTEAGWGR